MKKIEYSPALLDTEADTPTLLDYLDTLAVVICLT